MPRVGMVGGGQLARMTHQSAIALGQSLRVLSLTPDESAALVTPDVEIGSHLDLDALTAFAAGCDVVTFDHEHVPTEHIRALVAAGHAVYPGADALQYAQDKALMRARLRDLGLPVPEFRVVESSVELPAAVAEFGAAHGWPVVLKTSRGGYDGRGVWVLDDASTVPELAAELTGEIVLEPFVPMKRELAAVVARSPFGQAAAWPVVETVQQEGICVQVIAPAPELDADVAAAASEMALRIAGELDVVGVLAVELFQTEPGPGAPDGLLINELAMRPAQFGALVDGRVGDESVRATPTGGPGLSVGPDRRGGPVHGDGERARRIGRWCRVRDNDGRTGAPPRRPLPASQDSPVRQGVSPGSEIGPRQRSRV